MSQIADRCCSIAAHVVCPPIFCCFLVVTYISKTVLECFKPVVEFLGRQVFVIEVFCYIAWGLWIIYIGLPVLGCAFALFAITPSWPFAIQDAFQFKWTRCVIALLGFRHLQEYEGAAASPEMNLLATVLAKVPMLAVITIASAEGVDVLLSGYEENDWLRVPLILYVLLSGINISHAVNICIDAARKKVVRAGRARLEQAIDTCIDGAIARIFASLVLAIDMLTVIIVEGSVGGWYSHSHFVAWNISLWLFCGAYPAVSAPLAMPTLKPAVPKSGPAFWSHRCTVSFLLTVSPATEYMPLMPDDSKKVWAVATFIRSAWLLFTTWTTPRLRDMTVGAIGFLDLVILGASCTIAVAMLNLFNEERLPVFTRGGTAYDAPLITVPSPSFGKCGTDEERGIASADVATVLTEVVYEPPDVEGVETEVHLPRPESPRQEQTTESAPAENEIVAFLDKDTPRNAHREESTELVHNLREFKGFQCCNTTWCVFGSPLALCMTSTFRPVSPRS